MATFDATRPIVAAMAIGVGRAALEFVRDFLAEQNVTIRYGLSPRRLSAVERDFMEMEVQLEAARLLAWRAAWMMDVGQRNSLEASMAKAKAGLAVTQITQKAVELLGPLGYSRALSDREVDARRQDQRHLRGHAADQPADHRAAYPGLQQQGTELSTGAPGSGAE